MKDAWKFLSGSVMVYVVMAACSYEPSLQQGHGAGRTGSSGAGMLAGSGRNGRNGGEGGEGPNGGEPSMGGMMGMAGLTDPAGGAGDGPRDAGVMDALADAMTDPVPDADASPMTGTRLKRRYWVGEDGSREPVGEPGGIPEYSSGFELFLTELPWYDSELDVNCRFRIASDGATRCLPASYEQFGAFADGDCTVPVLVASDRGCDQPVKYAFRPTDVSCEGVTRRGMSMYAMDTPLDITTYYGLDGTYCYPTSTSIDQRVYAMGPEVPPTAFVGLTIEVEQ